METRIRRLLLCLAFTAVAADVHAQQLAIGPNDLLMEQEADGGYHLWIRKTDDVESVLLTESTADPDRSEAVYALRNPEYHPVNGDEKRMLNGEFLDTSNGLHSLIDSTPEEHEKLGEAFHVYIPYIVVYGYEWARSGEMQILDGSYLNIRAFSRPYADYSGAFSDNPFVLNVVQRPLEGPPEDNYMADTLDNYREIAEEAGGEAILSTGEGDILDKLEQVIDRIDGESLDFVLALDTTESMKNDFPHLRTSLIPMLREITARFSSFRFGLVVYKDYFEQYVARAFPFEPDMSRAQRLLDTTTVFGGRDIPEAVYEALYEGLHKYPWEAENRLIILIGDAPPHPRPRGRVTKEMVFSDARELGVQIHTIILPQ